MSLAHYLLQVNFYLVIFYCFYKLLLSRETYFVLNRIYLLASGAFSLAIPFLRFEWFGKQEVAKPIYVGVDQLNSFVAQVSVVDDKAAEFNWGTLMVSVYLLGVLFCLARLIYQLLAIRKLITNIGNGTAFSFFRKKIISPNVPEIATVDLHEEVHIKQLHTVDVLFFELLGIFTWFNPVIYIYKKTIKNIHEYLADEEAAKFQGDKEMYSLLLLSQAFGVRSNTLTNGFFNKSLIKKRIYMLHKQRSKKAAILKYGLFVPLFALTLVLSAATIRKNDQILAIANTIPLENVTGVVDQVIQAPLSVVNLAPPPPTTTHIEPETSVEVVNNPEVTIAPVEGESTPSWNGFYKYLADHISYPGSAVKKYVQGNSLITFSVRTGKIYDVIVQNELGEGCDEEVVQTLLSYNDYLSKDGEYSLKVSFKLAGSDAPMKNENVTIADGTKAMSNIIINAFPPEKEEIDRTVYNFVAMETPPTYPGGMEKFYETILKSIKYPIAAIDNEISGKVHLSFTVEKDGALTDIKVDRKLGYGTDEEAVRVLKLSKKWNPGLQNGKAVRVKYNLPLMFTLDVQKKESKVNAFASIKLKGYKNDKDAPLFIVDNEVKDASNINDLDPNKISNISILKSETAVAAYGKKGANGVVIITTKDKPRSVTATLMNKN